MVDPRRPAPDPSSLGEGLDMARRRAGPQSARRARIALAHDWLVGMRGGELVLDRLCAAIAQRHDPAGLYVMFASKRATTPAIERWERTVSGLNRYPPAWRRWLLFRYPAAVRSLSTALGHAHARSRIDLLISSSSAAVKSIEPPEGVKHLCYCHAPARYLWSRQAEYHAGSFARRTGLRLFGASLRAWDSNSVKRITKFVANSRHTAREIERVYRRDAEVVHPPVRTHFFTPDEREKRQDFWLLAGALEPYKRADLAIEAAITAGRRLMIAGEGTELKRLRALAASTGRRFAKAGLGAGREKSVEFLGRVPDEQLRTLYRRAALLVFPQVEDFGIAAVEAQSCGCPVVARREGGALDTVLEGRTGAFFDEPTPAAIVEAAGRCPSGVDDQCRRHALTFGEAKFDEKMLAIVERLLR